MKIIFWGTPQYSVNSLENLISSSHEVSAVITQPDKKRKRGSRLVPSPIKEIAISNNIPVFNPEKVKDNKSFITLLKGFEADIFIVVAYGKILSEEVLNIPKFGSWNAHASLLPRWRGAAPIQWALLSGDKYTGVGIMKMEKGLDTGDILLENKIKINPKDNLETLTCKLSLLSADLLLKALDLIRNKPENLKIVPQQELDREVKYARMISKKDYALDLNETALNIERNVKGFYPRSFIIYKNKNLKILKLRILNDEEKDNYIEVNISKYKNKPGMIIGIKKDEGIIISTKTLPIIILEIKLEGKNLASNIQIIQQLSPIVGNMLLM